MRLTLRRGDAVRLWQMPGRDKLAWSRALAAVALARVGLRAVSLPRLASSFGLAVCPDGPASPLSSEPEVAAIGARVRGVLARWPSRSQCLVGAMAAGILLRRRRPKLFIGVRRRDAGIIAHAWLDVEGGRVATGSADAMLDFVALRRSWVA